MNKLFKICKIHGQLVEKDIYKRPTSNTFECRICIRDRKNKNSKNPRLPFGTKESKICSIHGILEIKDIGVSNRKGRKNPKIYCKICSKIHCKKRQVKVREYKQSLQNTDQCQAPECMLKIFPYEDFKFCEVHLYRFMRYGCLDRPNSPVLPKDIFKICITHGELDAKDVYIDSKGFRGCIKCKEISNIKSRRKFYNLSNEEYEKILHEQNGVCAICKQHETTQYRGKIMFLSIDHCHKSENNGVKKIRGLLCKKCNTALGMINDSKEIAFKMIDYINERCQ